MKQNLKYKLSIVEKIYKSPGLPLCVRLTNCKLQYLP